MMVESVYALKWPRTDSGSEGQDEEEAGEASLCSSIS